MNIEQDTRNIMAVRQFNRFYTQAFGFLQKRILGSAYSLVEARTLYEIANREGCKASDIAAALDLDPGYLSRIIKKFETSGLIDREQCTIDARCQPLALTPRGEQEVILLADIANEDIAAKINSLGTQQLQQMIAAMQTIEDNLDQNRNRKSAAIIRSHRPGDIGWVVSVHGTYYAEAHNFNEKFEALVARICADFISTYDPKAEHCWIAELEGKNVGSIFLIREDETTAKLRLLFIDEAARGMGLGKQLVEECLQFARRVGYERVELYTNAALTTARHLYETAGFHLMTEDTHGDFGPTQTGQYWLLEF